jgi:hypothetical protein
VDAQEYPGRHFQLMAQLTADLATISVQVLAHGYDFNAFGSWWTTVRRGGDLFCVVFDGKERAVRLERSVTSGRAGGWEELCSWPTGDEDAAHMFPEVVARLRADA